MNVERVLDSLNLAGISATTKRNTTITRDRGGNQSTPLAMFKAQLLKHLLQIPSDRRLSLQAQTGPQAGEGMRLPEASDAPATAYSPSSGSGSARKLTS